MKQIHILFYSFTGNVLQMEKSLEKGLNEAEGTYKVYKITEAKDADIQEFFQGDLLVLGSPANGSEEIEKEHFCPFMEKYKDSFKGKKIFLFGSWGWGGGKYLQDWKRQLQELGATVVAEPLHCNGYPKKETKEALMEAAKAMVETY